MSRVLIWAHSDQTGGTEIACILYESLRSPAVGGVNIDVSLLTPYPKGVRDYFKCSSIRIDLEHDVIQTPELLRLGKTKKGQVDGYKTLEIFNRPPFSPPEPPFSSLNELLASLRDQFLAAASPPTLIISCGEPLALKLAAMLGIKGIIVSDIILTAVVRSVLENAGLLLESKVARLLAWLEDCDHTAQTAVLAPVEFASSEYEQYLSNGGVHCMPMGGLFYEPLGYDTLAVTPFRQLRDAARAHKIVFVFGGGGPLWLELYRDLAAEYQEPACRWPFALLMPAVETKDGRLGRKKGGEDQYLFTLYLPDEAPRELEDPGRLMYWYAACTLVVGRGGLVAQQIFATMLSDVRDAPEMLFIEEPGHPQIEHERRSLYNLGFVRSRRLVDFQQRKLEIIREAVDDMEARKTNPRHAVAVRYGQGMMERLGKYLLHRYL